jgi:hypothetical protein
MDNDGQNRKPEGIAYHLAAIIFGLALTVLGVGLSVTMVLLPVGIPVGLAGLGLLTWGLTPRWQK